MLLTGCGPDVDYTFPEGVKFAEDVCTPRLGWSRLDRNWGSQIWVVHCNDTMKIMQTFDYVTKVYGKLEGEGTDSDR